MPIALYRPIMRQEDLVKDPQGMFGLPDLPVCNALAFSQVNQKGFDILAGPLVQRFSRKEIGEGFRPVDEKRRTVRRYSVFLRASLISFPKRVAPFGIGDIHDFHHRNPLNLNRLSRTEALHAR